MDRKKLRKTLWSILIGTMIGTMARVYLDYSGITRSEETTAEPTLRQEKPLLRHSDCYVLQQEETSKKETPNQQLFAVLINNDSQEERHKKNLDAAYKTLTAKGVDPCTIYTISDNNNNRKCQTRTVTYPANEQGIKAAFADLESKMK